MKFARALPKSAAACSCGSPEVVCTSWYSNNAFSQSPFSSAWSPVFTSASGNGVELGSGVMVGGVTGVEVAFARTGTGVFAELLGASGAVRLHPRVKTSKNEQIRCVLFIICATITQECQCVN